MKNAENTGKKKTWKRALIAACLALVMLAGGGGVFYQQAHAVASVVSLDVNPSIELTINRSEKVLTCKGLNADAAVVLMDMDGGHDLEGAKLDVAVNAIVGALVRNGYLDDLNSAILISVEDENVQRGERIQQELEQTVGGTLQSAANSAAVLTQSVAADEKLNTRAQQNRISTGKAYLVEQVQTQNEQMPFDELAALSVEELRDMQATGATNMPIGRDAAAVAAETYAGVGALDFITVDVDPELDERTPCYEVELLTAWGEYEYRVDAYTGAVLSGKANILADAPSAEATPAPAESTPAPDTAQSADVGEAAAKAAALAQAGLTEDQVKNIVVKKDYDDGRLEYEVELWTDTTEFDCTVDGATGTVRDWDSEPVENGGTAAGETDPSADVGEAAAKAAALAQAGLTEDQVKNIVVKKDYDDGRLEYEVELWTDTTEFDCTVDGATGTVRDWDSEPVENSGAAAPDTTQSGDVGEAAAKAAALAQAGLTEDQVKNIVVKKDYDDGRLEYEVELWTDTTEFDCTVDGATGTVRDWDSEPIENGGPVVSTPASATKAPAAQTVSAGKNDRDDDDDDDRDDDDDDDRDDDDNGKKQAAPKVTEAPAPKATPAPTAAPTKAPATQTVSAGKNDRDDDDDDDRDDDRDDHDDDDDDSGKKQAAPKVTEAPAPKATPAPTAAPTEVPATPVPVRDDDDDDDWDDDDDDRDRDDDDEDDDDDRDRDDDDD